MDTLVNVNFIINFNPFNYYFPFFSTFIFHHMTSLVHWRLVIFFKRLLGNNFTENFWNLVSRNRYRNLLSLISSYKLECTYEFTDERNTTTKPMFVITSQTYCCFRWSDYYKVNGYIIDDDIIFFWTVVPVRHTETTT